MTPPSSQKPARAASDARDRELMARVRDGSNEAFCELVGRHETTLLAFMRRLGAHPDEAEDAVQESFLRLHAYRKKWVPSASFRAFLFTIAQRAWIDLCRRRERRRKLEVVEDGADRRASPEGLSHADRVDLEAALETLSEGHRVVLVLSVYGGLSYQEVSEALGIPEGTVKSRVFHALRKLRGVLEVPAGESQSRV